MKELCDKLMKLNPSLPFGNDFSPIALADYFKEEGLERNRNYSVISFATYLYRFYSDIEDARNKHYHKLINEINHYQPCDIYEYTKNLLRHIEENIGLIMVVGDYFRLEHCPDNIDKYKKVIISVIQTLNDKFLGSDNKEYDSRIAVNELNSEGIYYSDSRVFYRAMEIMNYCFITDETSIDNLCAVELKHNNIFKDSNYLILSKKYGEMYISGELVIKRNGYPYINGKRIYEHIEIGALKKIRENLDY